ncbi:MAG: DUF6612 family protein [Actinomycetota bacterium]
MKKPAMVAVHKRKKAGRIQAAPAIAPFLAFLLATVSLAVLPGCGNAGWETSKQALETADMTAEEVLERSVEQFMSLKSYRYRGTVTMTVEGNEALNSESEFDTLLQQNDQGGMDGHMVVTSREGSGSYETYTYRGTDYTRLEGGDWYRVEGGAGSSGLVSLDARRIIAEFASLVEDVEFAGETDSEYVISMVMGPAYFEGAAEIVGTEPAAYNVGGETTMTITVDKETLNMTAATMTQVTEATADTPAISVISVGTYSEFDEPVDVQPPPEALNAPLEEDSSGEASQ